MYNYNLHFYYQNKVCNKNNFHRNSMIAGLDSTNKSDQYVKFQNL